MIAKVHVALVVNALTHVHVMTKVVNAAAMTTLAIVMQVVIALMHVHAMTKVVTAVMTPSTMTIKTHVIVTLNNLN